MEVLMRVLVFWMHSVFAQLPRGSTNKHLCFNDGSWAAARGEDWFTADSNVQAKRC